MRSYRATAHGHNGLLQEFGQRGYCFSARTARVMVRFQCFWIMKITTKSSAQWTNQLPPTDYMHLTKRFGIVAASQLPFHYLLAFKPTSSPLTFAFRSSHEVLNPYHRMLGRIIILLLLLHGSFYMNFFALSSLLPKRLRDRDVVTGLTSLLLLLILGSTSISSIRNLSYGVFYLTHLFIATLLPLLLIFHVSHIRLYVF